MCAVQVARLPPTPRGVMSADSSRASRIMSIRAIALFRQWHSYPPYVRRCRFVRCPRKPLTMTNHPRSIRICGTGVAVPEHILTSDELDRRFGLPAGTIFKRYGVRSRHQATHESAAQLAAQACEASLAEAGLRWCDIDCLVAASATMDQALPYNAAMILETLGTQANRIAAFDIGASCMSFLVALDTLSYLVESVRYGNVMIVSADIATFSLDWSTLGESAIFGDGAAAAVIRKAADSEPSAILASRIETYAEG